MKAVLFVIACLIAAALAAPLSTEQKQFLFTKFVTQYNKQYETVEVLNRFNTFSSNIEKIIAHNAVNSDVKLGVNQFADLTNEEFVSMLKLQRPQPKTTMPCGAKAPVYKSSKVTAEDVDWRKSGHVAEIQNQGQCGSCWAFSAVAPLETAWAEKAGKLTKLSEQQLVDCAGSHGNEGCNGGLMTTAYDYYIENGGACAAADYKYTARDGSCQKCSPVAKMSSYTIVNGGDALMKAVATNPVSVAVAASGFAFQFYSSGVIKGDQCSDKQLDHGVVVVGFANTSGAAPQHYIVRNSWGQSWGESGHFRLEAGRNCLGIESTEDYNSFPVV